MEDSPDLLTKEEIVAKSPSLVKHGILFEIECIYRSRSCVFIELVANELGIPKSTSGTAEYFLQRFFLDHSFKDHNRFDIATACLFLASKVEETPVKLTRVLQTVRKILSPDLSPLNETELISEKEKMLVCERVLLYTISFDLSYDHPSKHVLAIIKQVKGKDKYDSKKLTQSAIKFANDSLQTVVCLVYHPRSIAAACVYLAAQYVNYKPLVVAPPLSHPDVPPVSWSSLLGVPAADVRGICQEMVALYGEQGTKSDQDSLLSKLVEVEKMDGRGHST